MFLDLYFFTFFVPFYPDFPALHPLCHSFLSAHFPSKEEASRRTITLWFLFVCLVGWLCVCPFTFWSQLTDFYETWYGRNNHPYRPAVGLALCKFT
jgi:hypothetical protein